MAEETTQRRVTAQELPTNPFVDVGMILFLEDIAEKQGVEGLMSYMINQGAALAEAMPAEDYGSWDEFVAAVTGGRSILSALEGTIFFAGSVFVTPVNPFHEAYATYIKLMGELLPAHREVAELYNGRVQNAAVESMAVIHQSFRRTLIRRVTIGGQPVGYAELGAKGFDGIIKVIPEGWQEVLLEKAGISATQLLTALRQNSNAIVVYQATAETAQATPIAAARALGAQQTEEELAPEVVSQEPEPATAPEEEKAA